MSNNSDNSDNTSAFRTDGEYYRMLSPVTLAFMGDAVYEILVREYLIRCGNAQADRLHRMAIRYVKAGAQARAVETVLPYLTQEEQDILRRGRNANTSHIPKNADVLDYRHATGLEALFGYLFLLDRAERARELFEIIIREPSAANRG